MSDFSVARIMIGSLLTCLLLINIEEWGSAIDKVDKVSRTAPDEVQYALTDLSLVALCGIILLLALTIFFLTYLVDILRFIFRKK